jgi:hypothetical protein
MNEANANRAVSADARAHGQQSNAPALGEPLLRKALSSKASHSSKGSSFVKQLSAALGWNFSDDEFQETVMVSLQMVFVPCIVQCSNNTRDGDCLKTRYCDYLCVC